MTPDDFKQKCDEIHTIVCYLLDNQNIHRSIEPYQDEYGINMLFDIDSYTVSCYNPDKLDIFEIAVELSDDIKAKDV